MVLFGVNVAVTIDVPALPTSNLVPETTTTEVSADTYDHVPVAAVVATTGETIVMSGSSNVAVASDHENVGVALSTVSVALVVAVVKLTESVGENIAVMTDVPPPVIVAVEPLTVATEVCADA